MGYISVIETLKVVTETTTTTTTTITTEEKYRVVAPEAMHETFMSDSEEEGGKLLVFNLIILFQLLGPFFLTNKGSGYFLRINFLFKKHVNHFTRYAYLFNTSLLALISSHHLDK